MAADPDTGTAPDPAAPAPPAGGEGTPTLAAVAEKVDQLAGVVQQLVGRAHDGSQDAVQTRLDSPGSVQDQVRDELARAKREQDAAALQEKVETTAQTVAALAEKTPAAPVRRVTRVMFGKDPAQ